MGWFLFVLVIVLILAAGAFGWWARGKWGPKVSEAVTKKSGMV